MIAILAILALAIIAPLGYFAYSRRVKKATELDLPTASHPGDQKTFTLEELSQYDGVKRSKVYISLKGVVFDVSSSPKYQPGASYAAFAGKDISVALAKMSFDDQYYNCYQKIKLTKDEIGTMEGWFNFMKERYQVIGQVKESKRDE